MLLINPPVTKICEVPAGIGKLYGFLKSHNVKCNLLDASLEGILYLMNSGSHFPDTWSKRAGKNLSRNLEAVKSFYTYKNIDRYKRVVNDLNRLLEMNGVNYGVNISLANYEDEKISPLKSDELLNAAENFEENIFYPYFSKRLEGIIEKEAPVLTGFSLNYMSQALCTFSIIGFIKKRYPYMRIILGGGLVTSWLRKPGWKNHFSGLVDDLVAGPGEIYLLEASGKKIAASEDYIPDYSSLPVSDYFSPGFILPYNSSIGCYWKKCLFCPERAEGNPYIQIKTGKISEDVKKMVSFYKPSLIHILDNAISPAVMEKLAKTSFNVPWYGFTRFTAPLEDINFCMELKKSGCIMLKLGLESGSPYILEKLDKGVELNKASIILENLRKAGISTYVYLLFGTPFENVEKARETLNYVVSHCNEIGFLNLAIFNMPHYSFRELNIERTQFYEGDLSLYTDFSHPEGWSRYKVRRFLEKEFKSHPAVSAILKRNAPFFTSNHAPFLVNKLH